MATKPHLRADAASRRFQPLPFLNRLYNEEARRRPMPHPRDAKFLPWQKELRQMARRLIGLEFPRSELSAKRRERTDCGDYWRLFCEVETSPELWVPFFVLIPKRLSGPAPAVLCLHGHGYGMNEICGLNADGTERTPEQGAGYQKDFALQAVRAGFVALAFDLFGLGRRRDFDFAKEHPPAVASCQHPAMYLLHLGRTIAGLRLFDAGCMLSLLDAMEEVQHGRLGVVGLSLGGMIATLLAALDDRVRACCVSGYLNEFRRSVLAMPHCVDNYVPSLGHAAEMLDLAGLIAPRPLLMECGTRDPHFPIGASRRIVENLQEIYGLLGVPERFSADIFSGEHEFSGRQTWGFLQRWLIEPPIE